MFKQLLILLKVLRDGKRSEKEIESIQYERLRSVLVSAYENVEYYRNIMLEAGYNPLIDYFVQISSQLKDDLNTISKQKLFFSIKNVLSIPSDPNGKMRTLVLEVS